MAMAAKNQVIEQEKGAAVLSADRAEASRKVAVAAEKVAAANSRLASEQAAVALQTLQKLINKVEDDRELDATPGTIDFKRYMMQTALEGVQQVSSAAKGPPAWRRPRPRPTCSWG